MEDALNIKIVDYGMGNIRSVKNAFELLNNKVEIINDPSEIKNADGIILPGVGAFKDQVAYVWASSRSPRHASSYEQSCRPLSRARATLAKRGHPPCGQDAGSRA